jgi:poly(hydroxyalkanoate) granule-associated protein
MVEMLHRIWLAGLGAVVKAQRGAPQLLEDLIEEGARADTRARAAAKQAASDLMGGMHDSVRSSIDRVRGGTSEALDNLEKVFRVRVHRALTQLGVPSAEEIAGLSKRVDALNTSIGRLARGHNGKRRARTQFRARARGAAGATSAAP